MEQQFDAKKFYKCGCGNVVSKQAKTCPTCGDPTPKSSISSLLGLLLVALFIFNATQCSQKVEESVQKTQQELENIPNKVLLDAIEQFKISSKQGDPVQSCVQAGLVTAAALQAKLSQEEYNDWKKIENKWCKAAGIR